MRPLVLASACLSPPSIITACRANVVAVGGGAGTLWCWWGEGSSGPGSDVGGGRGVSLSGERSQPAAAVEGSSGPGRKGSSVGRSRPPPCLEPGPTLPPSLLSRVGPEPAPRVSLLGRARPAASPPPTTPFPCRGEWVRTPISRREVGEWAWTGGGAQGSISARYPHPIILNGELASLHIKIKSKQNKNLSHC